MVRAGVWTITTVTVHLIAVINTISQISLMSLSHTPLLQRNKLRYILLRIWEVLNNYKGLLFLKVLTQLYKENISIS